MIEESETTYYYSFTATICSKLQIVGMNDTSEVRARKPMHQKSK